MKQKSAGILLYRFQNNVLEVLLVHPGGPFWEKKDAGAWSIPKGLFENHEDPLKAAIREMEEETGLQISGDFIELNPVKQRSGKIVYAWAIAGNCNVDEIKSNSFELEWPPKSGVKKSFPEIDKAAWFNMDEAKNKILQAQIPLIKELESKTPGLLSVGKQIS
ncbi:NUDIX domain-containing protein [Daejeonella oryzae]|uniref:NUDIX domain-containing protein n=1 Tax=Daejeonella oryzae TaxID=1122943 RepID=UPI000425076A|nr:NUDIX domain-containing protein [Daejeonella oryzae]